MPPPPVGITFTVNGSSVTLNIEPDTPLIYALRNDAGLASVRYGCGIGRCGACMVLIDGAPVQSCSIPLADVSGADITTVEGLGTIDRPHPLQQAFLDRQAAQCGYCIPGIIISAEALLARSPSPKRDEIREALDGNLCRCGAHTRILDAIELAVARRRRGEAS